MKYLTLCAALLAAPAAAQETPQNATREEGLAAWERIFTVTSHPRCTNCHVGDSGQPMWEGLGYKPDAVHGMNVQAGESRIGAESITCDACHVTSAAANTVPHAPPHIDDAWRLPPVELDWLGKTSAEVCAQLRDPDTNDGHDIASLVDHLRNSAFVAWGFTPGAGRSAPEGSLDALVHDVNLWGAAGTPCATN
ncbi:hypothetical protein [Sulfitobacter delicatus]|uniref:Uncharacterized protein n=1 Tax=Sulfitobacter delicatus TaxID=218672 RepID=A0A1G7M5X8_9RHOB|nr:hypothetical protein [Sulfitobacter delicatus]SDF56579.1 hypothetical protein SAMN04489759_102458 [Sulfitobacter delicatus]